MRVIQKVVEMLIHENPALKDMQFGLMTEYCTTGAILQQMLS